MSTSSRPAGTATAGAASSPDSRPQPTPVTVLARCQTPVGAQAAAVLQAAAAAYPLASAPRWVQDAFAAAEPPVERVNAGQLKLTQLTQHVLPCAVSELAGASLSAEESRLQEAFAVCGLWLVGLLDGGKQTGASGLHRPLRKAVEAALRSVDCHKVLLAILLNYDEAQDIVVGGCVCILFHLLRPTVTDPSATMQDNLAATQGMREDGFTVPAMLTWLARYAHAPGPCASQDSIGQLLALVVHREKTGHEGQQYLGTLGFDAAIPNFLHADLRQWVEFDPETTRLLLTPDSVGRTLTAYARFVAACDVNSPAAREGIQEGVRIIARLHAESATACAALGCGTCRSAAAPAPSTPPPAVPPVPHRPSEEAGRTSAPAAGCPAFRIVTSRGEAAASTSTSQVHAPADQAAAAAAAGTANQAQLHCAACGAARGAAPLKACAGCRLARYCGPACQTAHWRQHKVACRQARGKAA